MSVRLSIWSRQSVVSGAVLTLLAWFVFSFHDASVKLLVASLSAWQVLFTRSLVIVGACVCIGAGRELRACWTPPARGKLVFSAVVYAAAWIAYFTAARSLQLAELETIYYASPFIMTVLAVLLLREKVAASRWAGLGMGFLGALIACGPSGLGLDGPAALALLAAALWAYAIVLIRDLAAHVSATAQMLLNNSVFIVLCALTLPWWWIDPSASELALMLLVGIAGALAQYLLYEGIQRAPASLLAPLEYTGLVWAFALGFLIWGDVPAVEVFVGAGLIALSGAVVVLDEWRRERAALLAGAA
jgi:drug/metabolite transporter (DMT)-like permease